MIILTNDMYQVRNHMADDLFIELINYLHQLFTYSALL